MSAAIWYRTAKAQHTKSLAAPQSFALTGDGEHAAGIFDAPDRDPALLGPRLAEARYRDWQQSGGLFPDERQGTACPPAFSLVCQESEHSQKPLAKGAIRDGRDLRAIAILRELVNEFSELFPDELAAAKKYLAELAEIA
jgi:hypothetical protein